MKTNVIISAIICGILVALLTGGIFSLVWRFMDFALVLPDHFDLGMVKIASWGGSIALGIYAMSREVMRGFEKELPPEITELCAFLEAQGLTLRRKEGPDGQPFASIVMEYGDERITVRLVRDRDNWEITVGEGVPRWDLWCDVSILQQLVRGTGPAFLSISEGVEVIAANWPEVLAACSPANRDGTRLRIEQLRNDRMKRFYPE